jgi:hypothetical protein
MKYQINKDYQYIQSDDDRITGIGILKGRYAGVLYHYGKAQIVEDDGFAKLIFDYTIIHAPYLSIDALRKDEEFHAMIGDILTQILLEKTNEKTRNNDSEELDIQ